MTTKGEFYHWWSGLTNEERVSCWYDLDAMAHGEVLVALRDKLAKRDADLAAMGERVARAERENEAWRALFEHAEERGGEFGLQKCSDGTWYADYRDQDAEAETPQAAAIDLATKLGLLQPETKGTT